MNDQIKLAEAMGWGIGCDTHSEQPIGVPPGDRRPYGQGNLTTMPDPFTDANDDYAVLEWMNTKDELWAKGLWEAIPHINDYKIGDYARAALKVIE